MLFRIQFKSIALPGAAAALFCCVAGWGQAPPAARVSKGLPPRATPTEYLSHAQAGAITIAAEFDQHSVPTAETTLSTEDFVAVEVGIFGAAGAHAMLSSADFSLRINGKKSALPAEQFASVFRNLRDPSYEPPELAKAKESKGNGLNTGGNSENDNTPPVVHIPPEMERAMQLQVQNAALPEGDRALPVAGLIFFRYGGAAKGIKSVELLYSGAAGKATIAMRP
jgi:hypothetical protein